MRIAQLTSNYHRVSPIFQKAIGSHVAWLTNGLVKRGHDVHLFASSDSETEAELHSVSSSLSQLDLPEELQRYYLLLNISRCYEYSRDKIDLIHSHFNIRSSSLFSRLSDVPTLVSVHTPIDDLVIPFKDDLKNDRYVSFSLAQREQMPELNWYANIYHGVDINLFSFEPEPEDYLLYIGRITEDKGVHFAIETAKATKLPLLIAGTSYRHEGYWQKAIEPHIDGKTIRYLGEASFKRKIELFQKAKALLFPTQLNEVFGYAMIEAMSCGTPVIAWNKGSVPELVKHGKTGFIVNNVEEMIEAVKSIQSISRIECRHRAEQFFSVEKMVNGYARIYERIINEDKLQKKKIIERKTRSNNPK